MELREKYTYRFSQIITGIQKDLQFQPDDEEKDQLMLLLKKLEEAALLQSQNDPPEE